jgi:hypothetical protein
MQSEIITTENKIDTPKKFCVYYDEWSGDITNITSKPNSSIDDPYIEQSGPLLNDLVLGINDPRKFTVAELADGLTLVNKADEIRIRQMEENLSLIPIVPSTANGSEIVCTIYIHEYKMNVSVSEDTMYSLTGSRVFRKFDSSNNPHNSGIKLFIIEYENPFKLLDTIILDPIELLNNGSVVVDIKHLARHIAAGSIRILTNRIFKTYSMRYLERQELPQVNSVKNGDIPVFHNCDNSDIILTNIDDGWYAESTIDELFDRKIYDGIEFYIIERNNPNFLCSSKITLNKNDMKNKNKVRFDFDFDNREYGILTNVYGKKLTFGIKDDV